MSRLEKWRLTSHSNPGHTKVAELYPYPELDCSSCVQDFDSAVSGEGQLQYGAQINWYKLPVFNRRFPQFAKAFGWLPAPFQMTAPLRSIVNGAPLPVRKG